MDRKGTRASNLFAVRMLLLPLNLSLICENRPVCRTVMKTSYVLAIGLLLLEFQVLALKTIGAESVRPQLEFKRTPAGQELQWPGTIRTNGSIIRPYFEVQTSPDLRQWTPLGQRLRASSTTPDASLNLVPDIESPAAFFRLLQVPPPAVSKLALGGADVFGYSDAFHAELDRVGQITPAQFASQFQIESNYLSQISWDPTTAPFWTEFNLDPAVVNEGKDWNQPGYRMADFRLSAAETDFLKRNGFVVPERLASDSFAQVFYSLWRSDLPVFISCDSLLQAWHRTYDALLEEVEETYLFNSLEKMLNDLSAELPKAAALAGDNVLKESVLDADYFLTVARSLLQSPYSPQVPVFRAPLDRRRSS